VSLVDAHVFECQYVLGLLDDEDLGRVALGVAADLAGFGVGDVETGSAELGLLFERQQCVGKCLCLLNRGAQHIVREPLGAFGAYAGQFAEFLYQAVDRIRSLREGFVHDLLHLF
jgi:hypothetical protein